MACVHWTVEMEEEMTKDDKREALMVMKNSEKSRNTFLTVSSKTQIRWCQMKPEDGGYRQKGFFSSDDT